jgi:predicted enzyme related to lactoylglutathione lyase
VGGGPQVPVDERKDRVGAEIERLARLGATLIEPHEERGEYWVIMRDPEGNEFCLQ